MFFHREPGREKTSRGHPQVSPGSFPVPACGPRRDRPRFTYFGFCLWIAECWTNQFLSILGMLDFHAPATLSAMTQRCWYNLTARPASQNHRALDRRVFWAS